MREGACLRDEAHYTAWCGVGVRWMWTQSSAKPSKSRCGVLACVLEFLIFVLLQETHAAAAKCVAAHQAHSFHLHAMQLNG